MAAGRSPHPVEVNDRVELEVPEGPVAGRYPTRVEGVTAEALTLAAPLHKSALVAIPPGTEVRVHVLRPDPLRGARYVARGRVAGRQEEGAVPVVRVEVMEWERIQLRTFTRAPAMVPLQFRPAASGRRVPWTRAETRDLGGGGLMFWTKSPPEPGARLELVVEIPERVVTAVGEVVRVHPVAEEDGGGFGVAVRFVELSEPDRDRVIRFVLRRQAEMRRMGLL